MYMVVVKAVANQKANQKVRAAAKVAANQAATMLVHLISLFTVAAVVVLAGAGKHNNLVKKSLINNNC